MELFGLGGVIGVLLGRRGVGGWFPFLGTLGELAGEVVGDAGSCLEDRGEEEGEGVMVGLSCVNNR